jgi:hypothetical protein
MQAGFGESMLLQLCCTHQALLQTVRLLLKKSLLLQGCAAAAAAAGWQHFAAGCHQHDWHQVLHSDANNMLLQHM